MVVCEVTLSNISTNLYPFVPERSISLLYTEAYLWCVGARFRASTEWMNMQTKPFLDARFPAKISCCKHVGTTGLVDDVGHSKQVYICTFSRFLCKVCIHLHCVAWMTRVVWKSIRQSNGFPYKRYADYWGNMQAPRLLSWIIWVACALWYSLGRQIGWAD